MEPQWWIDETIGLMNGTKVRRFRLNPKRMEYKEPVGWWETKDG